MDNNLLLIDSNFLGNDIVITGPPEVAKAAIAGRRQYIFLHFQCMFADRIPRLDPLDQTDSQTVDTRCPGPGPRPRSDQSQQTV